MFRLHGNIHGWDSPNRDGSYRFLGRSSLKMTTRCHSVFSLRSCVVSSRQFSDVAIDRLQTRPSLCSERISGVFAKISYQNNSIYASHGSSNFQIIKIIT